MMMAAGSMLHSKRNQNRSLDANLYPFLNESRQELTGCIYGDNTYTSRSDIQGYKEEVKMIETSIYKVLNRNF